MSSDSFPEKIESLRPKAMFMHMANVETSNKDTDQFGDVVDCDKRVLHISNTESKYDYAGNKCNNSAKIEFTDRRFIENDYPFDLSSEIKDIAHIANNYSSDSVFKMKDIADVVSNFSTYSISKLESLAHIVNSFSPYSISKLEDIAHIADNCSSYSISKLEDIAHIAKSCSSCSISKVKDIARIAKSCSSCSISKAKDIAHIAKNCSSCSISKAKDIAHIVNDCSSCSISINTINSQNGDNDTNNKCGQDLKNIAFIDQIKHKCIENSCSSDPISTKGKSQSIGNEIAGECEPRTFIKERTFEFKDLMKFWGSVDA